MKRIKEFFEPSDSAGQVYSQSLAVQFGLGLLAAVVALLALVLFLSIGGIIVVFLAIHLTAIIEILFSIIFPLLKRHRIKFHKRLLIIVTSPGLILSIAYYMSSGNLLW